MNQIKEKEDTINKTIPVNPISKAIKKFKGNWSRDKVAQDVNTLYVFTDNTDRDSGSGIISDDSWYSKKYGKGHHFPTMTAAVIRGLANSRPISTQRWYHAGDKGANGRWKDSDAVEFEKTIRDELEEITKEFNTGKYTAIMFPDSDGLFNTKISNITKERTPVLYTTLEKLLQEFGMESLIPGYVKPTTEYVEDTNVDDLLSLDLTNPITKIAQAMSPVERKARAESIARAFSKLVSKTVEAAIDNLNNLLNETNDEYQVAEIRRKIAEYEHPYKGRAAVINENGINNFFEVIKETNFARWLTLDHAKWVRAEALALKKSKYSKINIDNETLNKEAEELTAKKEAAYKKIIDNWEVLVDDACVLLENREHASITREAISTDINSDIKDIENFNEEQDDNPEADLKDGISILKFRQMDPRTSLTREVREILGSIPMKGAYGKFITDDLGNRKYLDENYVYITILDYMSQIYNSDDFIDAMKSMIAKYPWMRAIVNKIEKNKDLEAKFYKAFRLDFIPSKIMKDGKFINLNKMSLVESNWNKVIRNYESGTVVDKTDSIYDEAGIPVRSK